MKKYKSPETILLNEVELQTPPESIRFVEQQSLANCIENTNLNYAYQISINQQGNDWNDPLNDHWDNY
jgi:hypothetical protein